MKRLNLLYYFTIFFLLSCTTLEFGKQENIFSDKQIKNEVREFNLEYQYEVLGVPIKGTKSIVESTFLHPDNKTLFIFISFPKIGILRTEDFGYTFSSQFFNLSFLDKIYGYSNKDKEKKDKDEEKFKSIKSKINRYFNHFTVSPVNQDNIVMSIGPYIFLSNDRGYKWTIKDIFFDKETISIRDIFINKNEEIFILTKNKILISKDWGKKWENKELKIEKFSPYKIEYITGFYDDVFDRIIVSIKHNDEKDDFLSKQSYDYFYNNKGIHCKSGVFFSKDFGNTWQRIKIPVPVLLWKYKDNYYGSSIYPLDLYKYEFDERFKKTRLYKTARLDKSNIAEVNEYVKMLLDFNHVDLNIIADKNCRFLIFNDIEKEIKLIEENNFENIYNGIKKIQYLDYVQWQEKLYDIKKTDNFFYEYNFFKFFKLWTGMMTNSFILYLKDDITGIYYRVSPDLNFYKAFIRYSFENQIKLNNIKPIFKKSTDLEFFNPEFDPTQGFPVIIEYSKDQGKTWLKLIDSSLIKSIIDQSGNKRSGLYWYKNVDQKKAKKLQISIGWSENPDYLVYPMDITILNQDILIRLNYFTLSKNYKDLYLIPINRK